MNDHSEPTTTQRPQDNGQPSSALSDRVRALRLGGSHGAASRRGGAGGRRNSMLAWGLVGILTCASGILGWYAYMVAPYQASSGTSSPGSGEAKNPATSTSSSSAESGEVAHEAKGYVIAAHQIQVSPEVSGRIVYIDEDFREGAVFEKNRILAKVDDTIYVARRNHAAAAVRDAEAYLHNLEHPDTGSRVAEIRQKEAALVAGIAALKQMQDRLEFIERTNIAIRPEERTDTANMLAKADADRKAMDADLEATRKRTVNDIASAKARLDLAQADLAEAERQLKFCEIRAPVTGTILTKKAEFGNYISPGGFNVSSSLCEMADLADLEIELDVQERDISRIKRRQKCIVMPDAFARDEEFLKKHPKGYEAEVDRLMPIANRGKGAVPVRVKLTVPKNEEGIYLRPEMGVIVQFLKAGK
jgi:multidrug resistance efflux pump